MARIARVVAPGLPHHVTQRGNRRQQTFFCDDDYRTYLELMAQWCSHCAVEIWAYCLMPNHVHLIAVPESKDGLRSAIGEAHRRAIHVASIFAKDGGAICGKDDLPLTRWKKGIFWLLPGTSR